LVKAEKEIKKPKPAPQKSARVEKVKEQAVDSARVEPVEEQPRFPDAGEWVQETQERVEDAPDEPPSDKGIKQASIEKSEPLPIPEIIEPVLSHKVEPEMPRIARRRGYQGTVYLEVLVSIEGRVEGVRVVKSSGHKVLDKAALKAVRKWRFEPARRGSEAIEARATLPVTFKLN
jgi:protein TonB